MLPLKLLMPIFLTGAGGILVVKEFNKPISIGFAVKEGETCKNISEQVEGNEVRTICTE